MPASNTQNKQSYLSRDYNSIKEDLINLLKVKFPEQFQDFKSVGIGMSLLELQAYTSDLLSYHTDKKFNELFLDGVTERGSVFRLAKTFGYKPIGYRPALTIVDLQIDVPATIDGPNISYLPVYRQGVQVKSNSQTFETINDCDFSSDFSEEGYSNRKIEPVFNSNQDILKYRIIKREKVKAGTTTIYQKEIDAADAATPFLEIFLPERNVLDILNIIVKPGINLVTTPTYTEFNNEEIRFFEVDELAQNKIFIKNSSEPTVNGVSSGIYQEVPQRFIKEFMSDGSCKITFGGGSSDYDAYDYYLSNLSSGSDNSIQLKDIFNNTALGVKLPANSTLYIKYRIGGGTLSNIGANTLQQVDQIDAVFSGLDEGIKQNVISSTRVNNPLPAIGGADLQTVEEIKYNIASNYAAQKRCITLEDYISRSYQIGGKFGAPFRIYGKTDDNKVKLYILSKDSDGKLISNSTNIIKNNLVEYLSAYRSINDFVEINDGKVINIQIEADLFIDKTFNGNEIKIAAIDAIKEFFDINNWQFNQPIYISQITDLLREIPGVINVVDIRLYNMDSGDYSSTVISQATGDRISILNTGVYRTMLEPINNTIFSTPISMFEIKFPEKDILVRTS